MIRLCIPGLPELEIKNLVLDMNGTISVDGVITDDEKEKINRLAKKVNVYILTADTFGLMVESTKGLKVNSVKLDPENGYLQKKEYIGKLGASKTAAIGNGYNDHLMLKEAVLGICVVAAEGASTKAILTSDVIVGNISDALDLFLEPDRLKATLRK